MFMPIRNILVAVITTFAAGIGLAAGAKSGFDDAKPGAPPAGWEAGSYGDKAMPQWQVTEDKDAPSKPNVLRHAGKTVYGYAVNRASPVKNGVLTAKFRIESGKEDPEAGIVMRFVDGKNYYYVRANSLENNIVFYRMSRGQKQAIKTVDAAIPSNQWQELKVEFRDASFKVFLKGKELFSAKDSTIKDAGGGGVWTTADTAVSFDDFVLESL